MQLKLIWNIKKTSSNYWVSLGQKFRPLKVCLKIGKKTYTAKTNSKGKALFKIKKLTKRGTYKAKVTFKGNKYFNKLTKTTKIKVKR